MPKIDGGSAAERRLLAQIVRGLGATEISRLTISPATRDWHPVKPGDVMLTAGLINSDRHHENARGEWEAWMVAGAFRDRSAALGLPRLIVEADPAGASRVSSASGEAIRPTADPAGAAAYRRRVRAALAGVDARVIGLRVGVPDGYSAEVTLQVDNPVSFLKHHLTPVEDRLHTLERDGSYLELRETDGRVLYEQGGSARLSSGLGGVPDRRYATCVTVGFGGPMTLAPPLPCPSNWRPPPSTPPKPPTVQGWESAGAGETVSYRPHKTFGLGFVLINPNGHPVTITAITPDDGPSDPIAYTGAKIQVPASRSSGEQAAELVRPFDPEPPLKPFTIAPGDWVGVGLHYTVEPCTAATAGRRTTQNQTLTLTYTLEGRTLHHTFRSQPYTLRTPHTCP